MDNYYRIILEQEPISIFELIQLVLFLGSITFLLGAAFQWLVLFRNKAGIGTSLTVIIVTRILVVLGSFFIWSNWTTEIDLMFLFLFIPGLIAELILSPLILKLFGMRITIKKLAGA